MNYKHLKLAGKRFLALMLSFVMMFSGVAAYAKPVESEGTLSDEALKEALEADTENYPDGGFEFFLSQLEGTEGDPQMELTIVRRGGNDAKASVDFKAVGVSAAYGEDYTLSVDESVFTKRVLESTVEADTLTETYGQDAIVTSDDAEAETEEASTEEETTEEASTEETEEVSTEEAEEAATEETAAEETQKVQLTDTSKKKSSLQAAKDTYLQKDSNPVSWTELDEASKEAAMAQMEEQEQAMEEFAKDVPGAAYTFDFAPGEYKKTVYIDIIDDTVSETDEQVMFLLSNAVNGELAGTTTAYLNIKDNDENEKAIFAMAESEITVDADADVAKIVVKRVSGTEKLASVIVGTGGDTAQPGVEYEVVNQEVLFTQGVTEQVVEIPLKGNFTTEEKSFQVALDPESAYVQEGAAITTVKIAGVKEEDLVQTEVSKDLDATVSGEWNDTRSLWSWGTASVDRAENRWSGRKTFLKDIDLSTADYITVTWKSDWGSRTTSYTYEEDCDEKTGYNYWYDRDAYIYINGNTAAAKYTNRFGWTDTKINLTDAMQTTNAYIQAEVKTKNTNNQASIDVQKVVIHYPGYTYTVANTPYTSGNYSNQYTEKIYTESGNLKDSAGHRYNEGTKFTIGTIQVAKNGSNDYQESVTVHRACDTVTFKHTYDTNKNNNGIGIQPGNDGNVYLVGYQLQKRGSSNTWSNVIAPDDFVFGKSFIKNYKDYLLNGNTFLVRPVYRPHSANILFRNSDASKGSYNNSFANNSVLRCTQLDTIETIGVPKTGYAIEGFSLGAYRDDWLHSSKNSANLLSTRGEQVFKQDKNTIQKNSETYAATKYKKVSISNAKWVKTVSNKITFTPDKDYVYLNMTYTTPKIKVKIDPQSSNKDKGAVVYTPKDDETVDKDSVLKGDKDTPLVLSGVTLNQEYTFNAVTEDGYKAYWKDFTGDDNEDGRITTAEEKLVSQYSLVRTANNGNAYTFRPQLPNSLIYYGFNQVTENRYPGFVDGVVALKTKPVFGDKETTVAVNGAQVSVSGKTVGTSTDAQFGGIKESGGDGYFSISDKEFAAGENVTVNVSYNNVRLTATQAVNAAALYTLDAYDTIRVSSANAYRIEGNKATKINVNSISNGDATYRIAINTYSTNDSIAARKAVFRFYRKDGSYINSADKTVASTNGAFSLDFNPKTLGIPTGATMTVQFYDQNDTGYFEHELGFSFAQSLGVISFLSSFNFGGAEKALEIIGTINSGFNFGWDGDIDKASDMVSTSEDGNTKTISLGFEFNYESDDDDEDEKENEKQKAVKDAAKNSGTSKQQKETQQKAANDAVDSGAKKNKSSAKVGASGSVGVSFALGVTMCKSEAPEHLGEWYFKDMMLCVKAEGGVNVKVTYTTPIGIPVIAALSVGASGSATFLIEQNYAKKEYYFSDVLDTEAEKIDLFNFNMNNADRAFNAYGIFTIAPYIDLSAGAGFEFLNLMIGGRADFDMNFYTDTGRQNHGSVNLSAYVKLKILFFEKKFDIASHNMNLFGSSVESTGALETLGDEDYRYVSLDTMEVNDRSYLKNRSDWYGDSDAVIDGVGSIATASGVTENTLLEGINPNPDTQLLELGNGEYLSVYLDDVPERNDYNSKALYYTIFTKDKGWSEAKLVEDDGTLDEAPAMFDIGDKIYVAWSTADKEFTEKPGTLEALMAMNIHGTFFDKATKTFGTIDEITETAPHTYQDGDITMSDNTADVDPHISYDADTNRMLIFYTKSEYESSSTEEKGGVYGDAANPYSLIAYRVYDFANSKWESTYTAEEGASEDYTQAWYGQRFLDLAPTAIVKETLDEDGYWAEAVNESEDISAYQSATLEDGTPVDPIVIESDAISYNGLALFTYVMDYDGNRDTVNDRDIFLQIYNYAENTFTHPIMVTNDTASESNIRLARGCNATILAYISDGTLKAFNISKAVRERLIKTTVNAQEFYYIDRSRPATQSTESGEEVAGSVYEPVMTIAGKDTKESTAEVPGEEATEPVTDVVEEVEEAEDDGSIASFDFVAADNYIYAIWPQSKSVVKEGIDPTSEEAQQAENRLAEAQLYAIRFDNAAQVITEPVQVTEEAGANYADVSFAVNGDGSIKLFASKSASKVETSESEDGTKVSYPVADDTNKSLVCLDFNPKAVLTVKDVSIEELSAGVASPVNIELYNDGLGTLDGLTFTATDMEGNELYKEEIATPTYGGGSIHMNFPITLAEDATGCKFTYKVTDTAGNVLVEDTYEEEIPLALDVTEFTAELTDRNTILFSVGIKNNSRRSSGEQTITISKNGKNSKELLKMKADSIRQGESANYEEEFSFEKYEDMFYTYIDEDSESYEAVTKFTATTNAGEDAEAEIELTATKEQRLKVQSVKEVQVVDESNAIIKDNTLDIALGEVKQLQTAIKSVPYGGSRYEGMDDEENTNNASGLRVMYETNQADVVQIYDSGYIEGLKKGTATVTAYVLPNNNHITYNEQDGTIEEDNFTTLPEEAILTKTITVKVDGGAEDIVTPPTPSDNTDTTVAATGINLSQTKASIAVKGSIQLSAEVVPANATDKTITWSSSNPSVATVTDGKVIGVKAGTAVITAETANHVTATCQVTVNSVKFEKSSVSIGLKETYETKPVLSKDAADKLSKITVKSSNTKVAQVKKTLTGKVKITGKKKGTAKITVTTTSGAKAVLKVTVKAAPTSIKAKKSTYSVKKGKTAQIKYSLSKGAASGKVTFKSSNKKIATVSESGKITGKKKGTTKITIKTYNGKKATVKVVVK